MKTLIDYSNSSVKCPFTYYTSTVGGKDCLACLHFCKEFRNSEECLVVCNIIYDTELYLRKEYSEFKIVWDSDIVKLEKRFEIKNNIEEQESYSDLDIELSEQEIKESKNAPEIINCNKCERIDCKGCPSYEAIQEVDEDIDEDDIDLSDDNKTKIPTILPIELRVKNKYEVLKQELDTILNNIATEMSDFENSPHYRINDNLLPSLHDKIDKMFELKSNYYELLDKIK